MPSPLIVASSSSPAVHRAPPAHAATPPAPRSPASAASDACLNCAVAGGEIVVHCSQVVDDFVCRCLPWEATPLAGRCHMPSHASPPLSHLAARLAIPSMERCLAVDEEDWDGWGPCCLKGVGGSESVHPPHQFACNGSTVEGVTGKPIAGLRTMVEHQNWCSGGAQAVVHMRM
ncbi:hypothetical protein ACLOJK_036486 [Asimina triloba]